MEQLDQIIKHLKQIGPDFYGQVIIRIKNGKAWLIEEQKTTKLDDEQDTSFRDSKNDAWSKG